MMVGNWKMNMNHLEAIAYVQKLAFGVSDKDLERTEVAVLPPFTDLRSVQTLKEADRLNILFGAQDVSAHKKGPYTGEISATMLAKLKVDMVLIGHSERRAYYHEDDDLINAKLGELIANHLRPLLAVGETLPVRQAGEAVTHVIAQLSGCLKGVSNKQVEGLLIAYEPVWAIGTGEVASPQDAQQMCQAIREWLSGRFSPLVAEQTRVLYGGSVKASNVKELMNQPDVDGALVGGACLEVAEFLRIIRWPDQL
jgi:triosephosphate isomerase